MARVIWAASLGSASSRSMSAVRTSCPVTRATPRRSAASRCQMSRARCVAAGRSTVRRVRWVRAGWSPADWSRDRSIGWMRIPWARGARKPVRRSVGSASPEGLVADIWARDVPALGPMRLGLKFTAAVVPPWVPISKSGWGDTSVATDSLTKVTLSRVAEPGTLPARCEAVTSAILTFYLRPTALIFYKVAVKNIGRRMLGLLSRNIWFAISLLVVAVKLRPALYGAL
jgi:hypothetical protein